MNKAEFLKKLEHELGGIPECDIRERLSFYEEMINDKIEDGMSEDDAISSIGEAKDIAEQIISETPLIKLARHRLKPKRKYSAWEVALFWGGSPIWFSLLISLFATVFSIYVSGWAALISLWAVAFSFAVSAICAPVLSVILFIAGSSASAILMLSGACILGGLAIFFCFGFSRITRWYIRFTKGLIIGLKRSFTGKEKKK